MENRLKYLPGTSPGRFQDFSRRIFTSRITEGTFSNAKIGEVLASDADLGFNSEVVFSLSDPSRRRGSERSRSPIKINPLDGTVYVNGTLNREKTPQIDLTIIAGIIVFM